MASSMAKTSSTGRRIPSSLIPVVSTSLNVGMALGAWITVIPFANVAYPGPAVAVWFKDFFKPGFIGITSLSAVTIASGIRSARTRDLSGTAEGQAKAKTASRWAIAGLVFTLVHFGFGNSVRDPVVGKSASQEGLSHKFYRYSKSWIGFLPIRNWLKGKWLAGSSYIQ